MVIVSVIYPAGEGTHFDINYYLKKHVPMVEARWKDCGLREAKVLRGSSSASGDAPTYLVLALLTFDSAAGFQRGLERNGPEIVGDIPNFTDVQPIIQINDILV